LLSQFPGLGLRLRNRASWPVLTWGVARRVQSNLSRRSTLCLDEETFVVDSGGKRAPQTSLDATWCPVCKKQKALLSSIEQEPRFHQVTVLKVDIDAGKDIMKSLDLSKRSVFIAYKGSAEVGRSIADTNKDSLEALFAKAL
jgi:thioredoxin 1